MVFDKGWFHDNQKWLLWLLNNRIIGRMARRILWIWEDRKLHELGPSWYVVESGNPGEFVADFRVQPKYARRLYHIGYPIWWLCHLWDTLTAFVPALNLGFDTYENYPDTGTGATTIDGYVCRTGISEGLSTIHYSTGTGYDYDDTSGYFGYLKADTTTDKYSQLYRSYFIIDTSALTSSATISAGTMSLYGSAEVHTLGDDYVYLVGTSGYTNSFTNYAFEYSHFTTTVRSNTLPNLSAWNTSGYNDFPLNTAGKSGISKTAQTKLGAMLASDTDISLYGTWGSGKANGFSGYFADDATGTKDPKLVVTYTLPSPFTPRTMII